MCFVISQGDVGPAGPPGPPGLEEPESKPGSLQNFYSGKEDDLTQINVSTTAAQSSTDYQPLFFFN